MVRNQRPLLIDINHVTQLRREAAGLLQRLEASRQTSEQLYAETGKRDAMRSVTGRSTLERAIETTRGMICDMDHLLHDAAETFGDDGRELTRSDAAQRNHATQLVESR